MLAMVLSMLVGVLDSLDSPVVDILYIYRCNKSIWMVATAIHVLPVFAWLLVLSYGIEDT